MKSAVEQSHEFLKPCLHKGAVCIDATLGHGKDALFFLKNRVRKVYGFEIQEEVYLETKEQIQMHGFVPLWAGHETMDKYVKEEVDVIVFNFGYCPYFDSSIKTQTDTSLIAVQKGLSLLKKKGRMALVFYPHEEGKEEARIIESYLETLDPRSFYIEKRIQCNQMNSPYLIGIEKY